MDEIKELLQESLNGSLYQIVISKGRTRGEDPAVSPEEGDVRPLHWPAQRRRVRPVLLGKELVFQVSSYDQKQVFHENLTAGQAAESLACDLRAHFGQMQVESGAFSATVLVSKKGRTTIRKKSARAGEMRPVELSHNRTKQYLLPEGTPVPFLVDLGVMTPEGKVVRSRYDKFRQINRFLEFVADVLPSLPAERPVRILDFGCGKSYLTFAMYYYLHERRGLTLEMMGLDLKKDVIEACSALAEKYGYEGLRFLCGDIADHAQEGPVDMVVALHACDTATDYALYQAIRRQAGVILCVPCCQHEMNGQMENEGLEGALKYGLIRERLSALFTDALRADLLEEQGYDTQILEFIEMEHTPKNVLIRAVKRPGAARENGGRERDSEILSDTLHARITLQRLLEKEKGEAV